MLAICRLLRVGEWLTLTGFDLLWTSLSLVAADHPCLRLLHGINATLLPIFNAILGRPALANVPAGHPGFPLSTEVNVMLLSIFNAFLGQCSLRPSWFIALYYINARPWLVFNAIQNLVVF
ncbi:hypothetical protein CKO42_08615 [Lamprobacter modestohalophilus]|uniref:Uncharacterized protein n=1 Tax=Lamprobacter modestohalophilus TaxID=1064514 RepID=A0A9X0W811_9GAMM|nr:hypothetical protein [Lamprobacter modestohalophilus]MBK1618499.1 hypothetical protein [Lamprobacter modestohalophilus]